MTRLRVVRCHDRSSRSGRSACRARAPGGVPHGIEAAGQAHRREVGGGEVDAQHGSRQQPFGSRRKACRRMCSTCDRFGMPILRTSTRTVLTVAPVAIVLVAALAPPSAGTTPGPGGTDAATSDFAKPSTYIVSRAPNTLPEGIDIADDGTVYVGSKGDGTIYRGEVHDRVMQPWLPAGEDGRVTATGVHVDPWGHVVVAGAESSHVFLYDDDGRLLTKRTTARSTFLNDFDFSGGYVYVTDSSHNAIYRATISQTSLGPLRRWMTQSDFSVAPDFINGLVATADGQALLVADWQESRIFRVDVTTGTAEPVTVHNGTLGGDGLLLCDHTLVAVDNDVRSNGSLTSFARRARFNDDYTEAWVLDDSLRAGPARQPTTIARDGQRLIWVESQFGAEESSPPFVARVVRGLN